MESKESVTRVDWNRRGPILRIAVVSRWKRRYLCPLCYGPSITRAQREVWRGLVLPVYTHINNASAISHVIDGLPPLPHLPTIPPIMASEASTGMLAAEQHPVGRKLDNAFVTPRIVCHWREFTLGLDLPSPEFAASPKPRKHRVHPNFPPKILPSHPLKHASPPNF